ncbi:MAG: Spx/MgsR family RNA polymerase-binding regulatory protein [Synechococcales cyanobacterium RM1_1_8]|nr:Spx/MgsR family RNA polymerase-binding regulatory protein [Synechococcales cyanobacterium RM1_1_8]
MVLKIYGIPNCGTCKKAIAWLEDNALPYEFINTKEQPPTQAQVKSWVAALTAKAMRNTSGQSYRALGPEREHWSDADWVKAFCADAMLLKRPLFERDGEAVLVGFRAKPEVLAAKLQG